MSNYIEAVTTRNYCSVPLRNQTLSSFLFTFRSAVQVYPKLRFGEGRWFSILGFFRHQSAKPEKVSKSLQKFMYHVPVNWKLFGDGCFCIYLYIAVNVKPLERSVIRYRWLPPGKRCCRILSPVRHCIRDGRKDLSEFQFTGLSPSKAEATPSRHA